MEHFDKYLRGDEMTVNEEIRALESIASLPSTSFKKYSSCCLMGHYKKGCDLCKEYENKMVASSNYFSSCPDINDDITVTKSRNVNHFHSNHRQHNHVQRKQILNEIENVEIVDAPVPLLKFREKSSNCKMKTAKITKVQNLLKYVDSLKITVYSLKLNGAGNRKVTASESTHKAYLTTANTYFVEYVLPDLLSKPTVKTRAKINTGLNPDKTIRYCSKKLESESIYFRQQSIHLVSNINLLDLSNVKIEFRVSFRSMKQRVALLIGKAVFNLGTLTANQFLSCEQELVLVNESAPVVLGSLKVSFQFGCDKLYFGKEFIDAISYSKENANLSENDSIHKLSDSEPNTQRQKLKNDVTAKKLNRNTEQDIRQSYREIDDTNKTLTVTHVPAKNVEEPSLMYALIYISEVRLLTKRLDTYLICRSFSRDDTVTSKTIYNDYKPVFNLCQTIPILIDEEFVNRLRDNYIIVEVWEKSEFDQLIGLTKLSLHQLYIGYRNPAIVKHLTKSPNPVIAVDWWEPISHPISNSEAGQLKALVALGTEFQIENLVRNRDIKKIVAESPPCKLKSVRYSNRNYIETPVDSVDNRKHNSPQDDVDERVEANITVVLSDNSKRDQITNTSPDISFLPAEKEEPTKNKTVLVADKYVQEPEVTISPSVILVSNPSFTVLDRQKVDAATQSEIAETATTIMDKEINNKAVSDTTNNSGFTQRDFLNVFLEQLISTRDLNQRNNSNNSNHCSDDNNRVTQTEVTRNEEEIKTPSTALVVDVEEKNNLSENKSTQNSITDNSNSNISSTVRNTSDLLDVLQKALCVGNVNESNTCGDEVSESFKAHIVIENALHLPSRKKCKSKKNKNKNLKHIEEILPSTYVTLTGFSDLDRKMTSIVPKCSSPRWDYRCDVNLPSDLLLNEQKRLIFKVWRKANGPSLKPNFLTDIVLGFAALDLTVLLSGLPTVQGWFNIVDFSSKCNGQIKIQVTPLENISKFLDHKKICVPEKFQSNPVAIPPVSPQLTVHDVTEEVLPSEVLSRALKRKFTELDEITQRLRQRLSAVTNEDSDVSNDDFADEFERDLNSVSVDTDLDVDSMIVTNDGAGPSHLGLLTTVNNEITLDEASSTSSTKTELNPPTVQENLYKLDSHLVEGKLKIDSLLEKLSLLTGDKSDILRKTDTSSTFPSRYVSGCSINQETTEMPGTETSHQILKDMGLDSLTSVDPDLIFNPSLFQQMVTASLESTPRFDSNVFSTTLQKLVQDTTSTESSATDLLQDLRSISSTSTNLSRHAPDGAGNISNHDS